MRKFLRGAFAVCALALPLLASAVSPPKPFSADYEVRRNDQRIGTGQVSLQRVGDDVYELVTRSQATEGLAALAGIEREERSRLRWTGNGLELVAYRMQQQAGWKNREEQLSVDRATGQVNSRWKDQSATYAAPAGLLDAHGTTAAIMAALAAGERGSMVFPVAGRRGVETQTYRVAAAVRLRTAIGTQRALRVERQRSADNGRITKLWFARNHGWLPLRIKQYETDGETLDLRITAIR
ncbi:hypothetical protein GCM10011521_25140 [Arenimonas soli]|uniref:DUF3108 domain-containing protein n=1 Tax=Arenimonas soli TaxID=2269504 RepID=A0ABQ1HR49_9GAMM|nr:DUF3108 domain-containing protein [Arenimonas soli]GGA85649.1 hypothetical protein GCM10011521_25140 [Arenimonas soli]